MIDKIVDKLIEVLNTELGPNSSASIKLGLVTNKSLTDLSPNKTVAVIEGQIEPQIFEIGIKQPATWLYQPIELQLLCKGTENEGKSARRELISLIRQTIYKDSVNSQLLALEDTIGDEKEKVLKYNIIRIRTDSGLLKGQFIYIAVFQLSFTTEINVI